MGKIVRRIGVLALGAVVAQPPFGASAQLTSESFLQNHGTAPSFSTSYTAGSGRDRVVIFVVTSEYVLESDSQVSAISLGGVPLRFLGTRENQQNKKNRLSLYYLPEAEIPSGPSQFEIAYTEPASSMIYIATAVGIRPDAAPSTPVFEADCYMSSWSGDSNRGRIRFAPLVAQPSDWVLSWVATGESDSFVTFSNGGEEFLDERRSSPGFSLAAALQSPQSTTTVAGDAFLTDGCHKRPLTMQFRLRPAGDDGQVTTPVRAQVGQPVRITVSDTDLNLRDSTIDSAEVTVTNLRTGQTITVVLAETGPGTAIFEADVPTAESAGGSDTVEAQDGDTLRITYQDALTAAGSSATRTAETMMLIGARLVAQKTVDGLGESGFIVPGTDVLYRIEVTNIGYGSVDDGAIFLVDALPNLGFVVGDPASGDSTMTPVLFEQSGAGLAFDYSSDVGFADPGRKPSSFADCPLRPGSGVVDGLGYLCVAPRGAMASGDPDPSFSVTFRMRVE